MKTKLLFLGFVAGMVSGVALTVLLLGQKVFANDHLTKIKFAGHNPFRNLSAEWPDSLDAVKADPANHKVVFENDKVRILEVFGEPHAVEPIHTHKWPSVMWSASPSFQKAHLIYYRYGFDSVKKTYFMKDSVLEQGPPANRGFEIPPEGPHLVKNLSNVDILAYRVEFKN